MFSQNEIPSVYSDIHYDKKGKLYYELSGEKFYASKYKSFLSLENMQGNPKGTENGIKFNFGNDDFEGTLYYGLINYSDSKHPMPVWFKKTSKIENGKAKINIQKRLSGKYDMIDWENKGFGTLGYRVANKKGELLYDGIISFGKTEAGFEVIPTILEGPFVNLLKEDGATISFKTNYDIVAKIVINGKTFTDTKKCKNHEISISGLMPSTKYKYKIEYGKIFQEYEFKTAHKKGERKPFVFAYASDSRGGQGGGEHNLYGANYYVIRKIAALANFKDVAFMQFTGDLINGYTADKKDMILQYSNWKRAVEPFAHYYPIIATVGNHETNLKQFANKNGRWKAAVDAFPFETESEEAVFAKEFVNPHNGPKSEDGAYYDPNPNKTDFPPYDETAFYYTYDNVAVIVLNSDYWYSPTIAKNGKSGGNLHAYIMDKQLEWLEKTIAMFEKDENIDHVFISQHTPAFPNGGHVKDDMWYNGNNELRPSIAGKPVKKGIIERRDEYLNILINKSTKVVALMTGDEHNYNKVKITPEVNIYPEKYDFNKLKRKRTIWQINNGSAGAPYYAQDNNTPWNDAVSGFSTQYVVVFIYVDGKKVSVKVVNPVTLELVDEYNLR
ncbi:MAG: hypothetical protein GXO49_04390 [Chlorobi bacterium]|nr:hypothetical protein [Chlorobiota bacterium]